MIPKIIHQMWLDKKISNNDYSPEKYKPFINSFREHNPEFIFEFWNMDRAKDLFEKYPEIDKYKNIWYNLPHHIQKCDMARFLIIYLFGGIYIDLDFVCFKNLSPLLDRELLLVYEPVEHSEIYKDPIERRLYNGFIGSVPKHKFWLDWLDFILESLKKTDDVMYTTGPINFRIFLNQSKYKNIKLTDTCDIIPLYFKNGSNYVTRNCVHRNNNSQKIDADYHKKIGNFTHTKWYEGSGWGAEQLDVSPEPNIFSHPIDNLSKKSNIGGYLLPILFIIIGIFFLMHVKIN
ncbi:MAG: glycosyl transferase [Satyrvirus sp.]|uniref:Glycosyl transferase n=1 Tax=Satyrvirus sp. TaxID=2487771 RepID=A0A3G5AEP9_9VIRU|nr:MAG: glycosyl transferase [Satyrvirus sp.]